MRKITIILLNLIVSLLSYAQDSSSIQIQQAVIEFICDDFVKVEGGAFKMGTTCFVDEKVSISNG
jgi:hypothetical protein